MNFKVIQFNIYIDTLNKYLNTKDEEKKNELRDKLELIKKGLLPVKYLMK